MKLLDKGIIIRRTIESDLPKIYAEGKNEPSFSDLPVPWDAETLADFFISDNSYLFTAVRKKKVLGFLIGSINDGKSAINRIMVKENFRKIGIGSGLVKLFLQIAENNKVEYIGIDVFRNDPDSIKFFNNRGFFLNESFVELRKKSENLKPE